MWLMLPAQRVDLWRRITEERRESLPACRNAQELEALKGVIMRADQMLRAAECDAAVFYFNEETDRRLVDQHNAMDDPINDKERYIRELTGLMLSGNPNPELLANLKIVIQHYEKELLEMRTKQASLLEALQSEQMKPYWPSTRFS